MAKEEYQFLISKRGFDYKVVIKDYVVNVELVRENNSYHELYQTLATTICILAQTHIYNAPPAADRKLLLMEYFLEKGWSVYETV